MTMVTTMIPQGFLIVLISFHRNLFLGGLIWFVFYCFTGGLQDKCCIRSGFLATKDLRCKGIGRELVELSGIEPLTSSLRTRRSPS
ncbi:hypothetical protein SBA5_340002 [Candidatus Sulfotelmatomonas gaucii]|uniref:Uncharacterized protein n=1 Tax=Candidatus Sulfuritelmatomonas gaucii TaxID=2043161 RepID=A0A2N9LH75_9BACT|nr:hypothetical protein SBA5_340002 [Candidatus Sulfotelmatomonas gaucii]